VNFRRTLSRPSPDKLVSVHVLVQLDAGHGGDGLRDGLHDVEDLGGDPGRSDLAGAIGDHRDLVRLGQGGSDLGSDLGHDLSGEMIRSSMSEIGKRER